MDFVARPNWWILYPVRYYLMLIWNRPGEGNWLHTFPKNIVFDEIYYHCGEKIFIKNRLIWDMKIDRMKILPITLFEYKLKELINITASFTIQRIRRLEEGCKIVECPIDIKRNIFERICANHNTLAIPDGFAKQSVIIEKIQDILIEICDDAFDKFKYRHVRVRSLNGMARCRGIFTELKARECDLVKLKGEDIKMKIGGWVGYDASYDYYKYITQKDGRPITHIEKMLYYEHNDIEEIFKSIFECFDNQFCSAELQCLIHLISNKIGKEGDVFQFDTDHDEAKAISIKLILATNYIDLIETGLFGREMAEVFFDAFIEGVRIVFMPAVKYDIVFLNKIIVEALDCWRYYGSLNMVKEWGPVMGDVIARKKLALCQE
jgi:hypothetical protein